MYDPDLENIVDYFHRAWESAILVAALELDLFGALHDGPLSAEEIAASRGLDAKGVRILLDALCPAGFVDKSQGRYALTDISARYLNPQSEHYPGPIHWGASNPAKWAALGRLADSVRRGGPVIEREEGGECYYRRLVPAIAYSARHVVPLLAQHLGLGSGSLKECSILDVACGAGDYGLELLRAEPSARLTLLDLPEVLELAQENVRESGMSERVDFLSGDVFSVELPARRYDLILLSHFLHSQPPGRCEEVIARLAGAQREGGVLAVHEFVPDEDRCARRFPLLFAMNMYISNGVGDSYTFSEIKGWLEAAGYGEVSFLDTQGRSSVVIGRLG
jgi:SAM-dependent methyltransferase